MTKEYSKDFDAQFRLKKQYDMDATMRFLFVMPICVVITLSMAPILGSLIQSSHGHIGTNIFLYVVIGVLVSSPALIPVLGNTGMRHFVHLTHSVTGIRVDWHGIFYLSDGDIPLWHVDNEGRIYNVTPRGKEVLDLQSSIPRYAMHIMYYVEDGKVKVKID